MDFFREIYEGDDESGDVLQTLQAQRIRGADLATFTGKDFGDMGLKSGDSKMIVRKIADLVGAKRG